MIKISKRFVKLDAILNAIIVLSLSAVNSAWAGQAAVPATFSSGQTLTAGALNGNFSELQTEVNDNDDRIVINAGNIGINASGIEANASDIANLQNGQTSSLIGTAIGTQVDFTASITSVDSLTLAAPKAGVVIFTSRGTMALRSHTQSTQSIDSQAICGLSTANNSIELTYAAALSLPAVFPTFSSSSSVVGYSVPLNLTRAISVSGPGDVTIYLNCRKTIGGGAENGYVQWLQTQAVFIPNQL